MDTSSSLYHIDFLKQLLNRKRLILSGLLCWAITLSSYGQTENESKVDVAARISDEGLQRIIWEYLSGLEEAPEDSVDYTTLTPEQKAAMLFEVISRPRWSAAGYSSLLLKLLGDHAIDLNHAKSEKGLTFLETAISRGNSITFNLLLDEGVRVPDRVNVRDKRNNVKELPTLAAMVALRSPLLIRKMIGYGLKPDSLYYTSFFGDFKVRYLKDYEHGHLFLPYALDGATDELKEALVRQLVQNNMGEDIKVAPIDQYLRNYRSLQLKLLRRDQNGLGQLVNEVVNFQKKYVLLAERGKSASFIDHLGIIGQISAYTGNEQVFASIYRQLESHGAQQLVRDNFGGYYYHYKSPLPIHPELKQLILQEKWYDVSGQTGWLTDRPTVQSLLLEQNAAPEKITINTREFLLWGHSLRWLRGFYAHQSIEVPDIFHETVEGNKKALKNHLQANRNPFVTDGFGLSLFELMLFMGLEKQVLEIIEKNQYLPIDKEPFFLAVLGKNTSILGALLSKTDARAYQTYLYEQALITENKQAFQWLWSNGFSAEDIVKQLGSERITPDEWFPESYQVIASWLSDDRMLQLMLDMGFPIDNPDTKGSLMMLAIQLQMDEVVSKLIKALNAKDQPLDPSLAVLAVRKGSARCFQLLAEEGLATSEKKINKALLEVAVTKASAEHVKQLVALGADPHGLYTKSNTYDPEKISRQYKSHTLADISSDLATWEYLRSIGVSFTPFVTSDLDLAIRLHDIDKVKNIIQSHGYLSPGAMLHRTIQADAEEIGRWIMAEYSYRLNFYHIESALQSGCTWFFGQCFFDKRCAQNLKEDKNEKGQNILHRAVLMRDAPLTTLFLEKGIDRSMKDDEGFTPLYYLNESVDFPEKEQLLSLMQSEKVPAKYDAALVQMAFFRALESREIIKVHEYLRQGADPNQYFTTSFYRSEEDELPPLMVALIRKQELIAQLLLLYGADPNVSHSNEHLLNRSPLSIALDNSMDKAARMLIYKGADLNFVPKSNNTYTCQYKIPLKERIDQFYPDKQLFFGRGMGESVDPALSFEEKNSLFLQALIDRDKDKIRLLFTGKEAYNPRRAFWQDHLFQYATYDFLQFFLDRKASGFSQYEYKGTKDIKVLGKAAGAGRADLVSELLKNHTYELSPYWSYSDSPGYLNPMAATIKLGARPYSPAKIYNMIEYGERSGLDETQRSQYLDVIRALANSNFYQDSVCIATSIRSRFFEATSFFLKRHDTEDKDRQAFLHIINGNTAALQKQLNAGLSPNTRLYGFSLLACAAWMDQPAIFSLLLEKGADVKTEKPIEDWWKTAHLRPELWAVIHGNRQMIEKLAERKVSFGELFLNDERSYPMNTTYTAPALLMWSKEKRDVFEWMLENDWIDHMYGYRNHTLLTLALKWDDPDLVHLLLQYPPTGKEIERNKKIINDAPVTVLETILYALIHNAEASFFELIKDHPVKLADLQGLTTQYTDIHYRVMYLKSLKLQQWLLDQGLKIVTYSQLFKMLDYALQQQAQSHFLKLISLAEARQFEKSVKSYISSIKNEPELPKRIINSEGTDILNTILAHEESLGITEGEGVSWLVLAIKNDQVEKIHFLLKKGKNWIRPDNQYNKLVYLPDLAPNYDTWEGAVKAIEATISR